MAPGLPDKRARRHQNEIDERRRQRHRPHRQQHHLSARAAKPSCLFDHDSKGMPTQVAQVIEQHGGFWPTLVSVLPALRGVAYVTRRSTSAALFRSDTLEKPAGIERRAHLRHGAGRRRQRAVPQDAARTLLARRSRLADGRRRRTTAGAIASSTAWSARPSAWCSKAARSWSRRSHRTASAAARWPSTATRSIRSPPVRRCRLSSAPG